MMKGAWIGLTVLAFTTVSGFGANGMANIKGTSAGSPLRGTVTLEDTASGLHVKAVLSGVPAGVHAFHIHEFGDCADMAKAAGSHYNPLSAPHGQVLKQGIQHAHAGDLGNVTADAAGNVSMDATIPNLTLSSGPYTVAGRAFVVHEKVDDWSQPTGNAGGRVACGVVGVAKP